MKFIKNIVILLSSLAAVITVCDTANAGGRGLNVGNGRITPGLEKQYLQFQLQDKGSGLSRIRVIPDNCLVGFGLRCNKTGTVLEQIIESNGGPTYQQMLMRAAGGENNYRRFANYYDNRIDDGPYMSVWRNHSSRILDAAQYNIGKPLDRSPVPGLRDITKNFFWKPLPGGNLRDDFVNFKYSYGRLLLQEAAKVPNIKEQILQMNLGTSMKEFYERQLLNGLNALQTGDDRQLQQNILSLLSRPSSSSPENDPWFGREEISLIAKLDSGETLVPDLLSNIPEEASGFAGVGVEVADIPGDVFVTSRQSPSILPLVIGAGLLAFLALLLLDGGGSSNSSSGGTSGIPISPNNPPSNVCDFVNPAGNQNGGVCETPILQPQPEGTRVMEPSTLKAVIILALICCLVRYKQRYAQTKS